MVGYEVLLDQASLGFFLSGLVEACEVSFEGTRGTLLGLTRYSLYFEAERISMAMVWVEIAQRLVVGLIITCGAFIHRYTGYSF